MATRTVVPRGDDEGGIGTAAKRWAAGFFNALSSAAHTVTGFTVAGFVKNTAGGVLSGGEAITAGDIPAGIDAAKIGAGNVDNTEFGYLNGVTSAIQTQLAGKLGLIKIGSLTRDMSAADGDVAYTGVGFVPKVVIFLSVVDGVAGRMSIGLDNISAAKAAADGYMYAPGRWYADLSHSICSHISSTIHQYGLVKTFDADGFTITWSKAGATTGTLTVIFLALA
jgi:hypothetical protein